MELLKEYGQEPTVAKVKTAQGLFEVLLMRPARLETTRRVDRARLIQGGCRPARPDCKKTNKRENIPG